VTWPVKLTGTSIKAGFTCLPLGSIASNTDMSTDAGQDLSRARIRDRTGFAIVRRGKRPRAAWGYGGRGAIYLFQTRRADNDTVAAYLGFHDATNFRRSFKRWTGQTPGLLRDALHV
jgi:hypothetical protein